MAGLKQKVFKTHSINKLRNSIDVLDYVNGTKYPADLEDMAFLRVVKPDGLLDQILVNGIPVSDFEVSKAVYTAYKDLTPAEAYRDNLWVYLTHMDLMPYMQAKYPVPLDKTEEEQIKHIQDKWFPNEKYKLRTIIKENWWYAYLTYDEENATDPWHYTKIFFSNYDFRMRFGELALIRSKEAMMGIFGFLEKNPELLQNPGVTARGRYISKYFNYLGASMPMAYMDRTFFEEKLQDKYAVLAALQTEDEVQNKPDLFS